jgi:hypothetical protein
MHSYEDAKERALDNCPHYDGNGVCRKSVEENNGQSFLCPVAVGWSSCPIYEDELEAFL